MALNLWIHSCCSVCVFLYMHVGQYSPGCILHMLNAYYIISTLQRFSKKTEVVLHVFAFFFFPSLVQSIWMQNPNSGHRGVCRKKSSLFTPCKQTDLCRAELHALYRTSCTLLQSVNFFMEKDIQQYTTDGGYVYIYCNDQRRSVLINAINEENGLKSTLYFILKLVRILGRLC